MCSVVVLHDEKKELDDSRDDAHVHVSVDDILQSEDWESLKSALNTRFGHPMPNRLRKLFSKEKTKTVRELSPHNSRYHHDVEHTRSYQLLILLPSIPLTGLFWPPLHPARRPIREAR